MSTVNPDLRAVMVRSSGSAWGGVGRGILYVVLIAVALLQIMPLVWLVLFSLKSTSEAFSLPPFALPAKLHWENYRSVWESGNIDRYFFNSVWITAASIAATILLASFVTFAITRMRWGLKTAVLGVFMIGLMIPVHSTLIPLFDLFQHIGLKDNQLNIVLSYTAFNLPVTIMILLGFYYALPREVEEAAIMDGCGVNRLFVSIILPMTATVIATAAIINMIYNWNEFIFVNTFISSDSLKTLTVGVQNFVGQYGNNWGAIGATLVVSILPVLLAFFLLSNRIVEGLAAGSVKG